MLIKLFLTAWLLIIVSIILYLLIRSWKKQDRENNSEMTFTDGHPESAPENTPQLSEEEFERLDQQRYLRINRERAIDHLNRLLDQTSRYRPSNIEDPNQPEELQTPVERTTEDDI